MIVSPPSKWPLYGLYMGVAPTTYKSWDDPPTLDIQIPPEKVFGPQKHTDQTPNLRRYSPGCLGEVPFSTFFITPDH